MDVKSRRLTLGREAVLLIVALWTIQFVLVTVRQLLSTGEAADLELALRRALICIVGMVLFYAMGLVLVAARGSVALRVAIGLPLAAFGSVLHTVAYTLVFYLTMPLDATAFESLWSPVGLFANTIYWFWGYLAWAVIAIALAYNRELRERDRRLAETEALAHRAQLRALRYQINPHFLFNALNASSALVTAGENRRAEEMIANLADFLRASLATDPLDDIPLDAELDYARLYLEIEQVRFADRLALSFDVPDGLGRALVPSLILQPIFENAIKYGVSPAARLVTIHVSARQEKNRLLIEIVDDGACTTSGSGGTGVGLANVAQRLATRFGEAGSLTTPPPPGGGFVAKLTLPLRYAPTREQESVGA